MKRCFQGILAMAACLCLCLAWIGTPARAEEASAAVMAEQALCVRAGCEPGKLLAHEGWARPGNSGSDWMAFVFAVNGVEEQYGVYLKGLEKYVTERYAEQDCLDPVLATDYHRVALTVLALGGDPRAFGRDRDGKPVDLVADGVWDFCGELGAQGLNGFVYALILMDACGCEAPADSSVDRQWLLDRILSDQNGDGGFGFVPGYSDVDMTAMTLTALAPYAAEHSAECERALEYLAACQDEDGEFVSFGAANAESAAQTMLALCSLGVDPEKEQRFIKNGVTLPDVLERYRLADGTYAHVTGDTTDAMATEQALLAMTALARLRDGGPRVYDLTAHIPPTDAGGDALRIAAPIAAVLLIAAATAGIVIFGRKKKHADADK
ncbi:MAG: terpene cyclase/mutase family protein [Oscillospiraceae bacterium]|nr:terpene cyclase/mutase family protein [Oscillospiraceae bacterium]